MRGIRSEYQGGIVGIRIEEGWGASEVAGTDARRIRAAARNMGMGTRWPTGLSQEDGRTQGYAPDEVR